MVAAMILALAVHAMPYLPATLVNPLYVALVPITLPTATVARTRPLVASTTLTVPLS
jgi:hypothetical protein